MSYKHVASAGDLLRFGCDLKVECTHCGAARMMSAPEVMRVHGKANLTHLEPRLKCKRCKKKAARLVVLGPVYPN